MKNLILPLLILTVSTSGFALTETKKETKQEMTEKSRIPKSDSDIVNMLMTMNTEEMNLSKLGKEKAKNPKIKDFANKMFNAHLENNDKAAALRREQNIKLTETKRSNKVKTKVEKSIETLKMKEGDNFDKAYMQAQVKGHQRALLSLETSLIPQAKDTQLKAMLEETKKHVESHLKEAQELQSKSL